MRNSAAQSYQEAALHWAYGHFCDDLINLSPEFIYITFIQLETRTDVLLKNIARNKCNRNAKKFQNSHEEFERHIK